MNLVHSAYLECIRKPFKSFIILMVLIFILTGELTGLSLLFTAQHAKDTILTQIGSKITFEKNDKFTGEAPIGQDSIEQITVLKHVVGINQSVADFAQPLNFKNTKISSGVDPSTQKGSAASLQLKDVNKNSVVIDGNLSIEWIDEFRTGLSKIVAGEYPSIDHPGALLEKRLADYNKLQIGDMIDITTERHQIKKSIPIVGIYSTTAKFEVTSDNPMGMDIYAYSPYNRIFTDLNSALAIFQVSRKDLWLDIYIDSPSNINAVGRTIKSMDINWSTYQLVNTTKTIYQTQAKQIETLLNYSKLIISYVSLFGAILLLLILSIWSKSLEYNNGVFIALGATKRRTLANYFLATTMLILSAIVISIISFDILSSQLTSSFLQSTSMGQSSISTFYTGKELDPSITKVKLDTHSYLWLIISSLVFLLISCISPLNQLFRLKTKDILLKK